MKFDSVCSRLTFFIGFGFLLAHNAFADFSGQFDVSNWTISTQAFGCGASSVNTSGAPASVALNTGTGCASIAASFTFPSAPSNGVVSFHYAYAVGFDGPADYPASYTVDGVATQFSNSGGATSQSGDLTFFVQQGQSFGFLFQAAGSAGQPDSLTISNFSFASTDFSVGCGPTKLADLIAAMNSASANPWPASVTLSPGCVYTEPGDVTSTAADGSPTLFQPINNSVTIIGNGATIARDTATGATRFFYVGAPGELNLDWVTLKDGVARGQVGGDAAMGGVPGTGGMYSGLGGAILNDGTLTADGVTFDSNQAIGGNGGCSSNGSASGGGGGGLGGAIFSRGSFTIQRSAFTGNAAAGGSNGPQGGCFYSDFSSAGGGGGGAGGSGGTNGSNGTNGSYGGGGGGAGFGATHGGTGGFAGGGGGGFFGAAAGEFGGDGAVNGFGGGGGGGLGGAIFSESGASAVINSTFSANAAFGGNSTGAAGNGGSGAGGGVFVHTGTLQLAFDTLSGDSAAGGNVTGAANPQNAGNATGGGIYVHTGATLQLSHTIVTAGSITAGTSDNGGPGTASDQDVSGVISSQGFNLVTTRGGSTGYIGGDLPDGSPADLGPLANNRGPTLSFVPQPASLAIDVDFSITCNGGFATDQRGDPRPFGAACDIGAIEVNDIIFRSGFDPPYD